jgi:primosomal protein DnaI
MATYGDETVDFKFNKTSLKESYIKASEDANFKKLVSRIKAKDDLAMKYTSKLEESVKELNNCSKCKGLEACPNKVKGSVYYPSVNGNMISFNYVACKYQKAQDELLNNSAKTFLEPFQIRTASIKEIDLTDKKRAPLIKWIKDFYKNYQKDKHIKGLFLHGSFGSGKTYILAALLNELAKNGANTVIMYYPEMLRNLKESFSSDFDNKMNLFKTCDVLLLDDLGAEHVTGWNRDEILSTILNYRMEEGLPTFITSNLNKEELSEHLSYTDGFKDTVKAQRIIQRINQLTEDMELESENRRV